jgi:hypothetical protein
MLPARLRECLRILRWREADLADASDHPVTDVRAWLDGRAHPPLAVAAWLEVLVKAHLSVPPFRSLVTDAVKATTQRMKRAGPPQSGSE